MVFFYLSCRFFIYYSLFFYCIVFLLFYGSKAHWAFLFTLAQTNDPSSGPNNAAQAQVHATNQALCLIVEPSRAKGPTLVFFLLARITFVQAVSFFTPVTALLSSLTSLHGIPLPCTRARHVHAMRMPFLFCRAPSISSQINSMPCTSLLSPPCNRSPAKLQAIFMQGHGFFFSCPVYSYVLHAKAAATSLVGHLSSLAPAW